MKSTTTIAPKEARGLDPHLTAFEAFEKSQAGKCPPWLRALRTSGISYFAELGFPTAGHEDWRFMNVGPIAEFPFKTAQPGETRSVRAGDLQPFLFRGLKAHRLVFVDGHFTAGLSEVLSENTGATIGNLAAAIQSHPALVERHLGRAARHEANAFAALNTAYIQDGAFVHVPEGKVLETPIHLLFIASQPDLTSQPRNLIVAENQSQVRIIEHYLSLTEAGHFTNAVTEIYSGENALVEHVKVQQENPAAFHVATIEAAQRRDSRVLSHSISLGARVARNDINLRLNGEGCDSVLNGLYFASDEQLVDHHTIADHAQPHCQSHEFYHGILGGKARGVFNGKIFVRQDAQKTDAKQTNKNLLLGDEATINTKPQLEILADDVKCTHGATVGQLDEEAIFYLRARGIGGDLARQMLVKAFAGSIIDRISIAPVRETLDRLLAERLKRELAGGKKRPQRNRREEPDRIAISH